MFPIHLYQNVQSFFKKQQFLEKESYLKSNIIAKLKLSNKYKNHHTKKYYIEKEIVNLTQNLDNLYKQYEINKKKFKI
jgi:hypothetical protein